MKGSLLCIHYYTTVSGDEISLKRCWLISSYHSFYFFLIRIVIRENIFSFVNRKCRFWKVFVVFLGSWFRLSTWLTNRNRNLIFFLLSKNSVVIAIKFLSANFNDKTVLMDTPCPSTYYWFYLTWIYFKLPFTSPLGICAKSRTNETSYWSSYELDV